MKNKMFVLILNVLLVSLFSPSVFSQDTVVRIEHSSVTPSDIGDIYSVDIVIENGQNVAGCQVWLTYNPTVLEYADFEKGRFFPADAFYGKIWFDELHPTETHLFFAVVPFPLSQHSGDGTIITLYFKVLDVTTSYLLNLVEGNLPDEERGTLLSDADRNLLVPHVDNHGNTRTDATPLSLGVDGALWGAIKPNSDVDYFEVKISDPGEFRLYTLFGRDMVFELQDSTGAVLPVDDDIEYGHYEDLRIRHNVSAGTYYVKVTGLSENYNESYRLRASFTPEPDDHGNTWNDATSLSLGESLSGVIETGNDVDYFSVEVLSRGKLTLYTTGDLDTFGKLERNTDNELTSDNNSGKDSNFRIYHDVIAQTYYVRVTGSNNSTGNYTIHARFTPAETIHLDGRWLWMIVPTEAGTGGAASINIDSLYEESQCVVTETWIASHGANEGDAVGDYEWTYEKIGDDDPIIGNINQTLIDIGWADENEDVNDHSIYALVQVYLEGDRTQPLSVPMHVGGDDAVKIWLNGEIVYSHETDRASSGYQDTFNVDLNPGSNLLMVKVSERTGAWRMFVGFDVPDAETKEDIAVLWPNNVAPSQPSRRPLVRVIYYHPSDKSAHLGDMSGRLLEVQNFFTEQMIDKRFGQKTFLYEMDENAPVVHKIQSDYTDKYLTCMAEESEDLFDKVWEDIERQWKNKKNEVDTDMSKNIYLAVIDFSATYLEHESNTCGIANLYHITGDGKALVPLTPSFWSVQTDCYTVGTIAHELGHTFGLRHNFNDAKYIMSYGKSGLTSTTGQDELSPSTAHWLNVHPAFNFCSERNDNTIIEIVDLLEGVDPQGNPTFTLKVKVTDMDEGHQIRLYVPTTADDPTQKGLKLHDYKPLESNTEKTVEFNITRAMKDNDKIDIEIHTIDALGNIASAWDTVSIEKEAEGAGAPIQVSLLQQETTLLPNYPNPLNPETWIPYQLANPADVTLTIYDIQGRVVRDLDLGHQRAGVYQSRARAAHWNGRNAHGEPVASGLYFYTLKAGDFTATRKMLIRK